MWGLRDRVRGGWDRVVSRCRGKLVSETGSRVAGMGSEVGVEAGQGCGQGWRGLGRG